jgi:hypothetical protein
MALSRILREVNVVVQRLQSLTTLLSQQAEELSFLAMEIRPMALIVSPRSAAVSVTDDEVAREDKVIARSGQDYATKFGVEVFIKDLGIATADIYHLLPDDEKAAAVASLGQVLGGISDDVRRFVSDGDNNPPRPEKFPAVLPQQIVKKRPSHMLPLLRAHRLRLVKARGTNAVDAIERQVEELRRANRAECGLRTGIDRCSLMTPFRESWKLLEGRFEELVDFAGGLATIFPGTATVESNFSVIGWEKDIYRRALTDFSLEGLLHARQFDRLRRL